MSVALNFLSTRFTLKFPLLQFLMQPIMPDIQMFHSSDTSLVAKCSGNIGVSVQGQSEEAPFHRTPKIVLHQFGFFQNFAHADDFTFTTAERVLSRSSC